MGRSSKHSEAYRSTTELDAEDPLISIMVRLEMGIKSL
jgi:hypothetical protein